MDKQEVARRQRNQDLLERMDDPYDPLTAFNKMDSYFPLRSIIKKDKEAMMRLYLNLLEGK